MKQLFVVLVLLCTLGLKAQFKERQDYGSMLGAQVTQDGKLFVMEDEYGNKPVTWDLQFKLVFEGKEQKLGHYQVGAKYEYAKLNSGELHWYGAEAGYNFTNLPVPLTSIKYELTPLLGYGRLVRQNDGAKDSFQFSIEVGFHLCKELDVIILNTLTDRRDYSKQFWRYGLAFGLQFNIDTNYLKKQAQKGTRF
tara:strand:- start:53453 stop:54034 length:582 start_codon:yes stop_codon:yes gene_type:complete